MHKTCVFAATNALYHHELYSDNASGAYLCSLVHCSSQPNMTITQTYYLAIIARKKLIREASLADHDLRLLVGHENLLDSLLLEQSGIQGNLDLEL